jgi:hypothetical protein
MNTEETTVGSVSGVSCEERKALAIKSMEYNMKDPVFISVFGTEPMIHFERNDGILKSKAEIRMRELAKRSKNGEKMKSVSTCEKVESCDDKASIPSIELSDDCIKAENKHRDSASEGMTKTLFALKLDP